MSPAIKVLPAAPVKTPGICCQRSTGPQPASLTKRWLLSTHQGSAAPEHLPAYLNEFTFRFNRRRSANRGLIFYRLMQLAVGHQPVRYRDIVANPGPNDRVPAPPQGRGRPPSLDLPRALRPWRTANPG